MILRTPLKTSCGPSRRDLLLAAGSAGVGLLASCSVGGHEGACADRTHDNIEGPFYKASAPMRASLTMAGEQSPPLTLTGRVLGQTCAPIAEAVLDVWHVDEQGLYDNAGFKFRGKFSVDADGRFTIATIVPPPYPGRPAHIHVKVRAPEYPILTTQLYFPGDPQNRSDAFFDPTLLLETAKTDSGLLAVFDFVLGP